MGKKFKFPSKKEKEKWVLSTRKIIGENLLSDFHIEMNGNRELTAEGGICVYEYKSDYIKLHVKNGYITISGNNFDIINYEENNLTFKGNISSVEFEF